MSDRIAKIADDLNKEPLARIMFGQRELFHSNFIAWFFEALPEIADQVFLPLSEPGSEHVRSVEREKENMDLVFRWPGRAPLVIENKVFSMPDLGQLDRYASKVEMWTGQNAKLMLLSMVPPPKHDYKGAGWDFLSYKQLSERMEQSLPSDDTYEIETVRRYASIIHSLSELIAAVAVPSEGDNELVWIPEEKLQSIASKQMRQSMLKLRGYYIARLIDAALSGEGDLTEPSFSNGTPMVTWYCDIVREGQPVRAGWQLQGGQFRRFVITPHTRGRGADIKAARAAFADRHTDLFDMNGLDTLLGVRGASVGPSRTGSGYGDYSPDFIYKYVQVNNLKLAELMHAAKWVSNRLLSQ